MNNVIPLFASSIPKISLVKPLRFEEVQQVIEQLQLGQLIMLNLSEVSEDVAQRITDVLEGSINILSGQSIAIDNEVYFYSLSDIEISDFCKYLMG